MLPTKSQGLLGFRSIDPAKDSSMDGQFTERLQRLRDAADAGRAAEMRSAADRIFNASQ
jgi:hypothetical protein